MMATESATVRRSGKDPRRNGRVLATHVGSLVRPPELVEILKLKEHDKPYDVDAYEATLRQAVVDVVRQQAEVGIDIVSDGEFGKSVSWSRYVRERLAGFEFRPDDTDTPTVVAAGTDKRLFPDFYAEYEHTQGFVGTLGNWFCTGPVRYVGHSAVHRDIDNLKAGLAAVGDTVVNGFLPVVAPASVVPWRKDEHYESEHELLFAVADALNDEYRAIVDAGLRIQIDDAYFAMMYDYMVASGGDYRDWAQLRTDALKHALRGIPPERARYHVCWGSWNAPHVGDAPLADIVDLILQVPVGAYALEQANPRHEHEWRIWEHVTLPESRQLIPGVISHATNVVEHPELVAERLIRLSRLVGRDNVLAGTDCGFAQGPFVQRVHPSVMWAKLQALSEGARLATQYLWP